MANTSVASGNVQPGGTVSGGSTEGVLNGGAATQTVVLAGGIAFSATISSGGRSRPSPLTTSS